MKDWLWMVEEYYGASRWALLLDKGVFTTEEEADQAMRDLREEADPKYDGPYRLAKYFREGQQ